MRSDELRRSSKQRIGRKRSFGKMSRSSDVDNTLDSRTKMFTKKARLSITSSSSSDMDSMAAAATQSLEKESSPGTNDPGLSIFESSSRSLDKVDGHSDIGCAELYNDVEAGTNAGIGFPVSGSEIVYCCEENTTIAEIWEEAPSPDTNDPGLLTHESGLVKNMDGTDFCEKGHHKGLFSSANTNVGKDEVRGVDVIS